MWIWLLSTSSSSSRPGCVGFFLAWPLWLKILLTVGADPAPRGVDRRAPDPGRHEERAPSSRDLLRQAEQQALNREARPAPPRSSSSRSRSRNGLAALKKGKLGAGGASALYTLPWYMIIGPPGAGKTTALKHSGLVFPFLDPRSGGGVRGVGGTRNCDWWFTNEAILLDTAGRYATEADDHDEWIAFVDMLRKYRSKKPINGVIIAISVTDLIEATDEQIDSYAKRLRARIDEITTRLQMVVPVYVTFTKVDLIAGFAEFFADLRKSERAQIFGMTFPIEGSDKRDTGRAFEDEFDLIVDSLHARAIRRVGTERQADVRQRIYQFPLEVAALKQNLHDFIAASSSRTTSRRRRSSAAPTSRAAPRRAPHRPRPSAGGCGPSTCTGRPRPSSSRRPSRRLLARPPDLFRRVVFPDQNVASRTRAELRRQFISRVAFAALAFLLAALLVLPSTYTFSQNLGLVHDSAGLAGQAEKVNWRDGDPAVAGKAHWLSRSRSGSTTSTSGGRITRPCDSAGECTSARTSTGRSARSASGGSRQKFAQPTQAELEGELAAVLGRGRGSPLGRPVQHVLPAPEDVPRDGGPDALRARQGEDAAHRGRGARARDVRSRRQARPGAARRALPGAHAAARDPALEGGHEPREPRALRAAAGQARPTATTASSFATPTRTSRPSRAPGSSSTPELPRRSSPRRPRSTWWSAGRSPASAGRTTSAPASTPTAPRSSPGTAGCSARATSAGSSRSSGSSASSATATSPEMPERVARLPHQLRRPPAAEQLRGARRVPGPERGALAVLRSS